MRGDRIAELAAHAAEYARVAHVEKGQESALSGGEDIREARGQRGHVYSIDFIAKIEG